MTQAETPRLPVPLAGAPRRPGEEAARGAGFEAHLLGQGGARRGLRAGEPALKGARAAYLSAHWRGGADRRPTAGMLRRVEV